jgi:lipid A ethanolaminephosphotransferase
VSAVLRPRPLPAIYEGLREKWPITIRCRSEAVFAFGISLVWLSLYNFTFWEKTLAAMWRPSLNSTLFIASVFLLVWCLQALLLLWMPTRFLMRVAASVLFLAASLSSYFITEYGALMNKDMLRNAFETDTAEVVGLINIDLILHLLVLGIVPALLVWRVVLPPLNWRRRLQKRAYVICGLLAVCAAAVFASSANYAVYLRAYKPIRFTLSPAAVVASVTGLAAQASHAETTALQDPGGLAQRMGPTHSKPLLVFIVIGETARAANVQLSGYARPTTRHLAARNDVLYFSNATACGTSTAVSVPCIFSHLPRAEFDVSEAAHYTNLLDSLVDAGFDVEWRDNNAGCKGVCKRVTTIDYKDRVDPILCDGPYCYDEVMLKDLDTRIGQLTRDTVIVFHQIGSHGPTYWQRYPKEFERFKPACRSKELQHCTEQEVINAYDNTIAYTDYVLSRQIELLSAKSEQIDSVLIYASDHGESLGEQGIYLHGMPYTFAPRTQKEVPMLMWMSGGYAQRVQLSSACVRTHLDDPVSHDFLYHTILGAAETRDAAYDGSLDIISMCRRSSIPADHE